MPRVFSRLVSRSVGHIKEVGLSWEAIMQRIMQKVKHSRMSFVVAEGVAGLALALEATVFRWD